MAEPRPLTPREETAFDRLPKYNIRVYDPVDNPFGFDEDGYLFNQMPQAEDAGVVGRLARDMAIVGYENALATEAARKGAVEAAGKAVDEVRAAIAADVQAAQDARTGAEAAASETAEELRATFTADVAASQAARKGAEDARDATGVIRDATGAIRDATAGIAQNASASADRSRDEANRAEQAAQSVDGPAIAASIAAARRRIYPLINHFGS